MCRTVLWVGFNGVDPMVTFIFTALMKEIGFWSRGVGSLWWG